MFSYVWEILICFFEALFYLYLFYKKLGLAPNRRQRIVFSILIMTTITSVLTIWKVALFPKLAVLLSAYILVALWTFDSPPKKKCINALFWSSWILIIITVADFITYSLALIVSAHSLEELIHFGSARIQFTLIYLLVVAAMVWIFTHIGEAEPEIPLLVRLVLLLFIGIGIFSVESMIDIGLVLQLSPEFMGQAHILTLLGYAILIMLFSLLLAFEYLGIILRRNRVLEQQRQLALIEQQQYQLMVSTAESLSDWKHDYQGQMRLISALIAEEKYAELQQFTSRMDEQFNSTASLIYTGNRTIDCVISLRMMDAKRHQISFETKLYLPKKFHFDEVAFSSLIGNILDNAIEACLKVPSDLRKIYFELKPVKKMLYLYCSNASDGHYLCGEQEMLRSTKKEKGHGIGMRRIRDIVEDVGGTVQFLPEESQFSVRIMIPLTEGLDENCNCRK